jgi:hypothetical protein
MTLTYRVDGWSVTLPIIGQRRRFVGFQDGNPVGRVFFRTRREARHYLWRFEVARRSSGFRTLGGRVCRASLTLRVEDKAR